MYFEEAIRLGLGQFSKDGAFIAETGKYTGRSTKERFIVNRPEVTNQIDWGKVNQAMKPVVADEFFRLIQAKLSGTTKTYKSNGFVAGFPISTISLSPWHIAFANNMFREKVIPEIAAQIGKAKKIQIFHDPFSKVSDYGISFPYEAAIILDMYEMKVCIIGTAYAGEIKKSAFTLCNFKFPELGIMPMHASANCFSDGSNSSIMFGLSGTGKTTLSAVHDRSLIGDDEIIWTHSGLSNLEGGCYAKLINLSPENEPEIFKATNRFGAILENVVVDTNTRTPDFFDISKTENTRGSYPITALENVFNQNIESNQPKSIIFLTADAFGALPAVAHLNFWQSQYHFVSGYTAKIAGTEIGIKEPQATFSACFGAPFMPRHPFEYAKLLAEFAKKYNVSVWLLNTGWTGGDYHTGKRFPIKISRIILAAIQNGTLAQQPMFKHPVFGFEVPKSCPGVENKWLKIPTGASVIELGKKFDINIKKFENKLDKQVVTLGGPLTESQSEAKLRQQLHLSL